MFLKYIYINTAIGNIANEDSFVCKANVCQINNLTPWT